MKIPFFKIMLALGCAASIAAISSEANAYYRYGPNGHRYYYSGHRVYYRSGYYYGHPVHSRCGYWRHGYWHPVRCR